MTSTQLFKTNNAISLRIVKTLIIKFGIYTNIFAEMLHLIWVSTVFKQLTYFSLGISKSHSLTYLKCKLESSNI